MKILTTPWKNDLLELVSQSKKSIKITSPFVKENICREVLSAKQKNVNFELITSFKLNSIHTGSLDLLAIENIINQNGTVKNHPKLHSKIYLFDDEKVIITSGNLTTGGLIKNYEYGIYTDNNFVVSQVVADFRLISNNEITGLVKKSDIDKVKIILSKIPKSESIKLPKFELETPEEKYDIIALPEKSITSSLSGWKLEVFNCLLKIPNSDFELTDLDKFIPMLKQRYPENNNIKAKIRQQLQYLRDIGLVEFNGNATYRKLWV